MLNTPSHLDPYQMFEEAELWHKICEEIDWEKDKEYTGNIITWGIDEAIVVYEQDGGYALTYLVKSSYWHFPGVCDATSYSPVYEFLYKPTQDDLMKFIKNIARIHRDFYQDCKVNEKAWIELTGESPKNFLEEIEKAKKDFEDLEIAKILEKVETEDSNWFGFLKQIFWS